VTAAPLESFVSRLVGVVPDVHELTRGAGEPSLIRFACRPPVSRRLLGCSLAHLDGASGGAGLDRDVARAAAVGEILERYSATHVPGSMVLASAAELAGSPDPATFALFAPEQYDEPGFPFAPFDRETMLGWVPALSLPERRPTWLPTQLALLVGRVAPSESPIAQQTSSGLACGASFEEAALSALYEVLERDAFMLAWSNRLELPLIPWEGEAALAAVGRRLLGSARVSVATVDASCFWGVPTVIAVVQGRPGDGAALAVGAAACATVEHAWSKAVAEACCVRIWLLHLRRHEPWQVPLEPSDVRDFPDHVRFHADAENARRASFLWGSSQRTRAAAIEPVRELSAAAELDGLCRRIVARGYRVLAADVTAPDVAAGGLKVVRVAVPGLVALDADHRARYLGGPRILEAAVELGLRDSPLRRDQLNSDPHPFP